MGNPGKLQPALWDKISITEGVIDEINDTEITELPFFNKYQTKDKVAVMAMPATLHRGETESIIGAIETGVNLLILDDSKAGKKANSLGINTMGTIGVLLLEAKKGIITEGETIEYMHKLREHSFWISNKLFRKIIDELKKDGTS